MTAIQLFKEYQALPATEQSEFLHFLNEAPEDDQKNGHVSAETKALIDQILSEHAELFQRLAQ